MSAGLRRRGGRGTRGGHLPWWRVAVPPGGSGRRALPAGSGPPAGLDRRARGRRHVAAPGRRGQPRRDRRRNRHARRRRAFGRHPRNARQPVAAHEPGRVRPPGAAPPGAHAATRRRDRNPAARPHRRRPAAAAGGQVGGPVAARRRPGGTRPGGAPVCRARRTRPGARAHGPQPRGGRPGTAWPSRRADRARSRGLVRGAGGRQPLRALPGRQRRDAVVRRRPAPRRPRAAGG